MTVPIDNLALGVICGVCFTVVIVICAHLFREWIDNRIHDEMLDIAICLKRKHEKLCATVSELQDEQEALNKRIDDIEDELDDKNGSW